MTLPNQENRSGASSLDEAREALEDVQSRLYDIAAKAHAQGVLGPEGIRRVRSLMKTGATGKVTSSSRAVEVRLESERFIAELEQRLGGDVGTAAAAPTPTAPTEDGAAAAGAVGVDPAPANGAAAVEPAPEEVDAEQPGAELPTAIGSADAPKPLRRGRPREIAPRTKRRALGELSPDEIAEAAVRRTLVTAMEQGTTAAAALRLIGRKDTSSARRWAQRVYKRYAKDGQLYDRRHAPEKRELKVMTSAIASTAELLWLHHRGSAASAIRQRIKDMIKELAAQHDAGKDISFHPLGQAMLEGSVELPSVPTLYRFFESLGEDKAKIRELGFSEWIRQTRTITKEQPWARHANERWEIDHSLLDTHVRTLGPDGLWQPARAWLTAIIDVYSRAIMAIVLSLRAPDAFTTAIALRRAILPKPEWPAWTPRGVGELLVLDNGKDFRAEDVTTSVNALGMRHQFCNPQSPDEKPHIERFFGTVTRNLLPMLPGYVDGAERGEPWTDARIQRLLTVQQLRAQVERWIVEFYHQQVHDSTQRRPVELWEEGVPCVNVPPREDLDVLLLQTDERKVSRGFIRFSPRSSGRKRLYYAPALLGANGRRVQLRYNPDDLASVMVYDALTRERLGEAWDVHSPTSPYSKESIRQQARDYRAHIGAEVKPLIKRGEAYFDHIAKHDRVGTKRSTALEQEMRDLRAAADAEIAEAERALATPGFRTAAEVAAQDEDDMVREMKERMLAAARAGRSGSAGAASTPTSSKPPLPPDSGAVEKGPRLNRTA